MKLICTHCQRESNSGSFWCSARGCPAGQLVALLDRGEWVGDVEILRPLVVLPTAVIYKAQRHGQPIWLKVAHPGHGKWLKREALFLRQLQRHKRPHPVLPILLPAQVGGAVKHYPYGKAIINHQECCYTALQAVEGHTLRDLLNKNSQPWYQHASLLIMSLADGINFLHRHGRLHLALHPSLVFIYIDRAAIPRPILLDLGLLGNINQLQPYRDTTPVPPAYLAPELITGQHAGPATDVYGLGLLLYEMLAARPAFLNRPEASKQLVNKVMLEQPLPLQRSDLNHLPVVTMRALEPQSPSRYADVRALFVALRSTLPPVAALPTGKRQVVLRFAAILGGTGLSILLLILLAAVLQ